MPIKVPDGLPAVNILNKENIFTMPHLKAEHQDIRPLRIIILNIMPTKIVTETQLLRLLSNTPLQVEIVFLHTSTYASKNTPPEYLNTFYKEFTQIKNEKYDGLIITGAPVEAIEFEEVVYWQELCDIMEWAKNSVYSSLYICWGAQASLYYNYNISKHMLSNKLSGIYKHKVIKPEHELVRGFDEIFLAPHSRYTGVKADDINACGELEILTCSEDAGVHIIASKNRREFFISGHSEYDYDTLMHEYMRDKEKGLEIEMPKDYFPNDDASQRPMNMWRSHAHLLFSNWLNYFVYQSTPYNIDEIK